MTTQPSLFVDDIAFPPERHPRTVQYLGSKARLIDVIRSAVDLADPDRGPVVDLFTGSGVVAAGLARDRAVTAVDIQEYSRVLASALLGPGRMSDDEMDNLLGTAQRHADDVASGPLSALVEFEHEAMSAMRGGNPIPMCSIIEEGSLTGFRLGTRPAFAPLEKRLRIASGALGSSTGLTITRHYGGVYFSYAQSIGLDCLAEAARALSPSHRDTALAAVLCVASDCVTSVGSHFAQPIRPRDRAGIPKLRLLQTVTRRRSQSVFQVFRDRLHELAAVPGSRYGARAIALDYRDFLESKVNDISVVYADPPYTRDHYSRFYHVLETIAKGDSPAISTVTVNGTTDLSRALYRFERHQSPFCIASQVRDAFNQLFLGVHSLDASLVLSYSPYTSGTPARPNPRLLTVDEVAFLAAKTFRNVDVKSAGRLRHSKFNSAHLNREVHSDAEVLLVCTS